MLLSSHAELVKIKPVFLLRFRNMEPGATIKFCFQCGKSATATFSMMRTAYGDDCISCSKVFEWYLHFKTEHESSENVPREGRSFTMINVENIE